MNIVKQTFSYYWRHVRRFPKYAVPTVLIMPFNIIAGNYLAPLVLASIINKLNKHAYKPYHVWASFGNDLILYFVIAIIGGSLLWRLMDMFYWRLEGHVEQSIQEEVFNHLMSQSADFHANEFAGSLVSSTNKLSSSYVRIADTTLFQVAPLIIGLIFVSFVMASRSLSYTLLLLGFSLTYIGLSFFVTKRKN